MRTTLIVLIVVALCAGVWAAQPWPQATRKTRDRGPETGLPTTPQAGEVSSSSVARPPSSDKPQAQSVNTNSLHSEPGLSAGDVYAIWIPKLLNCQGKLLDASGNPVPDTTYSVQFGLYAFASGGSPFWSETQTVRTKGGLFSTLLGSVTSIESVPQAGVCYVGMKVGADPEMTPRIRIASAGYAFLAHKADTANYALAGGGSAGNTWVRVGGDSVLYTIRWLGVARGGAGDSLYGTGRFTHTNLGSGSTTGASGQNNNFCTVGGGANNSATANDATVGGGTANQAMYTYATVAGGLRNTASGSAATVGGGSTNTAATNYSTVSGGLCNVADFGKYATVAGGDSNYSSDTGATVGGGAHNAALLAYSTVGGGLGDTAQSMCCGALSGNHNVAGDPANDFESCAVVAGGSGNTASALCATIGGGCDNTVDHDYATVGGGQQNSATYLYATVGGGIGDTARAIFATVGGGYANSASSEGATVDGGEGNSADLWWATVAGGRQNHASNTCATVGGGERNWAVGLWATVAGGYLDTARGDYSFAVGDQSVVPPSYSNSAAFNGQTATASGQTRVGILSKASGTFTIDHPLDPYGKILNHYFIEGPEMLNIYRGSVVLDGTGRADVNLPDYFDALNRNPMVQLTGVGTSDVYVAAKVSGNRFVIGGKPGMEVYWQVTGERKDVSAEATRRMMPVEQPKTGDLKGRMLDDDFLVGCMTQLVREGKASGIDFRTAAGRQRYEDMLQHLREAEQHKSK